MKGVVERFQDANSGAYHVYELDSSPAIAWKPAPSPVSLRGATRRSNRSTGLVEGSGLGAGLLRPFDRAQDRPAEVTGPLRQGSAQAST